MSPVASALQSRVRAVREHVVRSATVAGALWALASIGVLVAIAWIAVGGASWRQGSNTPLTLELAFLALLGTFAWLVRSRVRAGLAEARVVQSNAMRISHERMARSYQGGRAPRVRSWR